MIETVVVLSIVATALALPSVRLPSKIRGEGKIVGGQDADISQFPYQVSLRDTGRHFCGGSIYKANIIVTAAHCFYGYEWPDLIVVSGTSYRTEVGISSRVKKIVTHPEYDPYSMDYDVTILLLEEGIPFGPTVQPIALATSNSKTILGSRAYVSGWGVLYENGDSPVKLQYVTVMTMDNAYCAEKYRPAEYDVTDRMICAGEEYGGQDACQGDSGGPLVLQNKLIGIVSWGVGCARVEYPGVYSNVAVLRDWIDETVNELLEEV